MIVIVIVIAFVIIVVFAIVTKITLNLGGGFLLDNYEQSLFLRDFSKGRTLPPRCNSEPQIPRNIGDDGDDDDGGDDDDVDDDGGDDGGGRGAGGIHHPS